MSHYNSCITFISIIRLTDPLYGQTLTCASVWLKNYRTCWRLILLNAKQALKVEQKQALKVELLLACPMAENRRKLSTFRCLSGRSTKQKHELENCPCSMLVRSISIYNNISLLSKKFQDVIQASMRYISVLNLRQKPAHPLSLMFNKLLAIDFKGIEGALWRKQRIASETGFPLELAICAVSHLHSPAVAEKQSSKRMQETSYYICHKHKYDK